MLPRGWFGDQTPVLDGILTCFATPWTWLFALLAYARRQTRILTANDEWLDLIATDLLGQSVQRRPNESDCAFRSRIRADVLRAAATRPALSTSMEALTGATPIIFEPSNCRDTGAYGTAGGHYLATGMGLAYGCAGGWGNLNHPWQFFMTVQRPLSAGAANISGYTDTAGGYGQGDVAYVALAAIPGQVTEYDIVSEIRRILPVNSVAWLRVI